MIVEDVKLATAANDESEARSRKIGNDRVRCAPRRPTRLVDVTATDTLSLRGQFLAAPAGELAPPANGEVYLHELEGFAVRKQDGTPLGVVTGYYELPSGFTLEVQGPKREFMLPFRKEFVVEVDREARKMTVELPDGLIED